MPIIQLNKNERLISTSRIWEWQKRQIRKHRTTGEEMDEWVFFRNYMTLENALNDVANCLIRASKHEDILEAIKDVRNEIKALGKAITATIEKDFSPCSQQ